MTTTASAVFVGYNPDVTTFNQQAAPLEVHSGSAFPEMLAGGAFPEMLGGADDTHYEDLATGLRAFVEVTSGGGYSYSGSGSTLVGGWFGGTGADPTALVVDSGWPDSADEESSELHGAAEFSGAVGDEDEYAGGDGHEDAGGDGHEDAGGDEHEDEDSSASGDEGDYGYAAGGGAAASCDCEGGYAAAGGDGTTQSSDDTWVDVAAAEYPGSARQEAPDPGNDNQENARLAGLITGVVGGAQPGNDYQEDADLAGLIVNTQGTAEGGTQPEENISACIVPGPGRAERADNIGD